MKGSVKSVLLAWAMLASAGCGAMYPRNAEIITDHETIMAILQEHFPELYELHEQDRIEVDDIARYTDRDGQPKYRVSFRYNPH
jgi:hypothetical protein